MFNCPFFSRCSLSNEVLLAQDIDLIKEYLNTPGVLTTDDFSKSYVKRYCQSNYNQCARFQVVNNLGMDYLPANLLPNQLGRADEILNNHL
ncbi:hypothetical protein [Halanaerobacter jeridensis]|uniref:Uncharacterized protein n=1 Tax=Halanaerobacter jeridensis TaxID=706427 RepID=A0A938XRP7_9FIRM|nr:hypothetical protein [Halanaerobacter jeridensis]MBM7555574.1 hypothetical protein [Halanaerobacter jeridensis]